MEISQKLKDKLKTLPQQPGVYFHKDAKGKIIYIGKAANLKNRVSSYFQTRKDRDPKTLVLLQNIAMTDWITVDSEVEALFLESEFIKRYMPKFNIDLRDDKHWQYVRLSKDVYPVLSYVRRPLDDGASYYGPFSDGYSVRQALKILRKAFPYVTHSTMPARGCLQFHLGLCPGPEENAITPAEYARTVRQLKLYLRGEHTKLIDQVKKDMDRAAKKKEFEAAGQLRDKLQLLLSFKKQMIFGENEAFDLRNDQALVGLADRLQLKGAPRRIEAYDISHMQGSDNVASMVVFTDGVPHKDEYRRFKMQLKGNDDFGHMREVMRRRFSAKNLTAWPKPDLLLIDGGKGQLGAALGVLDELGITIPAIGLAKREEEIIRRRTADVAIDRRGHYEDEAWVYANVDFEVILLPESSHVLQLLQRVRDEAHRFAVTYHSLLRGKRATKSILDDAPGIGPATRKKLVKAFGSGRGVQEATREQLAEVIGPAKAKALRGYLDANMLK